MSCITKPQLNGYHWMTLTATEKLDFSEVYKAGVIQRICAGEPLSTAMTTFSGINVHTALDTWFNPSTTRTRATKQYLTPQIVQDAIPGCTPAAALLVHHVLARAGLTSYVPEFNMSYRFEYGDNGATPTPSILANLLVATSFYTEVFVPEVTRLIADVQSIVRDDLVTRNARYIGNLTYGEISRVFRTFQTTLSLKAAGGIATTERFDPSVYENAMLDMVAISRRALRTDRSIANLDLVRDEAQYLDKLYNLHVGLESGRKVTQVDVGAVKYAVQFLKAYLQSKFCVHAERQGRDVLAETIGFHAHENSPATPYVVLGKSDLFTAAVVGLRHFAGVVELSSALAPAQGLLRKAIEPVQGLIDTVGSFQHDLYEQHILTVGTARSYVKGLLTAAAIPEAAKLDYLDGATSGLRITDDGKDTFYQLQSVRSFMGQGQTGWGMLTYDRTLSYADSTTAVVDAILSSGVTLNPTPVWPQPTQMGTEISGVLVDGMRKGTLGRIVQPQDVVGKAWSDSLKTAQNFIAAEAARSVGLTKTTLVLNNQTELVMASRAKSVLLQLSAAAPNPINFDDAILYAGIEIIRLADSAFCDHAAAAMESFGVHSNAKVRPLSWERAYKHGRIATSVTILTGLATVLAPEYAEVIKYVTDTAYSTAIAKKLNIWDLV